MIEERGQKEAKKKQKKGVVISCEADVFVVALTPPVGCPGADPPYGCSFSPGYPLHYPSQLRGGGIPNFLDYIVASQSDLPHTNKSSRLTSALR
jgi:hypothetical protein